MDIAVRRVNSVDTAVVVNFFAIWWFHSAEFPTRSRRIQRLRIRRVAETGNEPLKSRIAPPLSL